MFTSQAEIRYIREIVRSEGKNLLDKQKEKDKRTVAKQNKDPNRSLRFHDIFMKKLEEDVKDI